MIDPSVCINKELSNIKGTVARANPKLKLEVASMESFPRLCSGSFGCSGKRQRRFQSLSAYLNPGQTS